MKKYIKILVKRIWFLVRYIVNRKISVPIRRWQWARFQGPFEYETVKGLKFILNPREYVDRNIYLHGIYERRFLEFIDVTLKSKHTMLDIGANIGNHAIYLSDSFEIIHAFDPNPEVAPLLHQNIAINQIDNIVVHHVGLSDANKTLPFNVNLGGNLGNSGFQQEGTAQSILLEAVRGDDYLADANVKNIDFVKIDVEGFELNVLRGLVRTIDHHRPVIAFECHAQNLDKKHLDEFKEILKGYTFIELRFAPHNASFFQRLAFHYSRAGKPELKRIEELKPRTYENILAIPELETFPELLELNDRK